MCKRKTALHL